MYVCLKTSTTDTSVVSNTTVKVSTYNRDLGSPNK